jgi:hypothetical protein
VHAVLTLFYAVDPGANGPYYVTAAAARGGVPRPISRGPADHATETLTVEIDDLMVTAPELVIAVFTCIGAAHREPITTTHLKVTPGGAVKRSRWCKLLSDHADLEDGGIRF